MTAELIGRFEQESAEWWKAREGALGGSEIAAVVGTSPWTSKYTLWHRKAGRITEEPESESMSWGKRLEGPICERWWEDYPDLFPLPGGTYKNTERRWQLANPDLLVSNTVDGEPTALLEVKTADAYSSWEWGKSGTDTYPPYYRDQVQWYLDVFGLPMAYVAVLIGGNDFRTYQIEYDRERALFLREQGEAFMQSIADGIPPALDGSESTYEAVRELHPDIDHGAEIELDGELWLSLVTAKAAHEEATSSLNLSKSRLMDFMGPARIGTFVGTRVIRREARGEGRPYLKFIPQPKESAA